jgi:hypothetical protein
MNLCKFPSGVGLVFYLPSERGPGLAALEGAFALRCGGGAAAYCANSKITNEFAICCGRGRGLSGVGGGAGLKSAVTVNTW